MRAGPPFFALHEWYAPHTSHSFQHRLKGELSFGNGGKLWRGYFHLSFIPYISIYTPPYTPASTRSFTQSKLSVLCALVRLRVVVAEGDAQNRTPCPSRDGLLPLALLVRFLAVSSMIQPPLSARLAHQQHRASRSLLLGALRAARSP